jgi:hypothetical protein
MPLRQARVVELQLPPHAEPLHHPLRAQVGQRGRADDAVDRLEAAGERRRGRLGGVAVAPGTAGQPPADLERRRKGRLVGLPDQAGEPDEGTVGLDGPQAVTVLVEVRLDAVDEGVALRNG